MTFQYTIILCSNFLHMYYSNLLEITNSQEVGTSLTLLSRLLGIEIGWASCWVVVIKKSVFMWKEHGRCSFLLWFHSWFAWNLRWTLSKQVFIAWCSSLDIIARIEFLKNSFFPFSVFWTNIQKLNNISSAITQSNGR